MQIDRNTSRFVLEEGATIQAGLEKLGKTNLRILFLVDHEMRLKAAFTDGDLRRWLLKHEVFNLKVPIARVANSNCVFALETDSPERIADRLSEQISHVPLLNDSGAIVAVASLTTSAFSIGAHSVNADSPCLVVAEIGNNHNGNLELGKQLVAEALEAGADCVKFQMRHLPSLYRNAGDSADIREDLGSQYVLDLLSRFQLDLEQFNEIFEYCRAQGAEPLCTPFDLTSIKNLEAMNVVAYKIASADLTNHELLEAVAATNKPMLISTGMSEEFEIAASTRLLAEKGARFVLLHCNSTYPAPFRDINLAYMRRLGEIGNCFYGYSGHERGIHVPIAAVALGAKVIEKHFTLDKTLEGSDHKVSLLPDEFAKMVRSIREVEQSMGDEKAREVSQGERLNRETLSKSLVINRDLNEGQVIPTEAVEIRSPGGGLPPYRKSDVIGIKATRNLRSGDILYRSDIGDVAASPRNYRFKSRFGIPVRYHDFQELASLTNVKLLEFHLSYKDLDLTPEQFFDSPAEYGLVVHAPELFANDHTLDLCADDVGYRQRSIEEMQRVIDLTRRLKKYFPSCDRPLIVTNVGGFTADNFLCPSVKPTYYERLALALDAFDSTGVELVPQTMPPYPWHFGGQKFHNLFVCAQEIDRFCREQGMRVCLDIAHSRLACNEFDWDWVEFVEMIAPHSAHLHISDCKGTNGEGLQIGEGDIDFNWLMKRIGATAPNASWVPEIWQGHRDRGAGFWLALERLEVYGAD